MLMELIESLKTGHDEIDADHAHIIATINAITLAAKPGDESTLTVEMLEQFIGVCEQHFRNEERILADAGYPRIDDHIEFHNMMLTKARAAQDHCMAADSHDAKIAYLQDMVAFLIDDIVRNDMSFVSFLQAQGVVR